jgi:hypothetical protein
VVLSLSERFIAARYARFELDDEARRALVHALHGFRVQA